MKNIALFGGSFDPPHNGHVAVVQAALKQLDIDKLIIVPAYKNPFKTATTAPPSLRLQWLQDIFTAYPHVEISDFEITKECAVPTIETVAYFQRCEQPSQLFLIIGADNLASLPQWHRYSELKKQVTFVVAHRDHVTIPPHYRDLHVNVPISSTTLRAGKEHTFIPERVRHAITSYYKDTDEKPS